MKKALLFCLAISASITLFAQDITSNAGYHRSTLYVIPVVHALDSFAPEILAAAENMPFPDRYNDMRTGTTNQVISLDDKSSVKAVKDTTSHRQYDQLLDDNEVAKEIVKYWFNFDELKGFNTDRLSEEGMYDASELKKELATGTLAGVVNLADAGDELIGKSFVLVNDISYIDHAERAAYASAVCDVISAVGKSMQEVGNDLSNTNTGIGLLDATFGLVGAASSLVGSFAELAGDLTKATNELLDIKGFAVCEVTHLYQLDWNQEIQNTFYAQYYNDDGDQEKIFNFLADRETFKLKYIGSMPTTTNNATAFNAGKYSKLAPSEQILITCSRTMDDGINTLQNRFPDFRVYTPITDIITDAKGKITGVRAAIGLKEGVALKKKYVIREMVFKNGRTQYKDVVSGVKAADPIWDNRFGIAEEIAEEAAEQTENTETAAAPATEEPAGTLFKTKKPNLYKGLLLIEK